MVEAKLFVVMSGIENKFYISINILELSIEHFNKFSKRDDGATSLSNSNNLPYHFVHNSSF